MNFDQLPSGILVPHQPPAAPAQKPPTIEYGPCEVRDPEARKATAEALGKLWRATGLYKGYHGLCKAEGDTHETFNAREHAFYQFSHLLLGDRDDQPSYEQWC